MRALRAFVHRVADTFVPSRRERELAAELESHLQLHIDDNVRAGMTLADARRQALLKFGPVERIKDDYRDRAGLPIARHVVQDVRFAARLLRKAPLFSLAAIVTIALAIGVNATLFTVFNGLALRPLAVPDGDRLVSVTIGFEGEGRRGVHGFPSMLSTAEYEAVRDQARAFDGVVAFSPLQPATLAGGGEPRGVLATLASCNYFDVLRVRLAAGRALQQRDCASGASGVVVLSDRLWRSAFAADPSIVGRTIMINRAPFVVVGITDPVFTGTQLVPEDLYVPMTFQPAIVRARELLGNRDMSWLMVMGRLKPGASLAAVRTDLAVIAGRLSTSQSSGRVAHLAAARATLAPMPEIRTLVVGVGAIILAAVALVLLIACANIANLLLARGNARRREIAVRMALGAARRRLVQQLLTESLLLAAIGGIAGFVFASWASRVVVAYLLGHLPPSVWPAVFDPTPDWRVAIYVLVLTSLTALAFGLVPALQATRRSAGLAIRDAPATDRRSSRTLQQAMVAVQVAVCLVLLLSAGLLARGLYRAQTLDPGLHMDGVVAVSYDLVNAGYTPASAAALQHQVIQRLAALPDVRAVAQTSAMPLSDQHAETRFQFAGTERTRYLEFSSVTPAYFDVLGIPLVRGRLFTPAELESERAIVVTESTARRLWPGEDPLTKALILDAIDRPVVGIVRDAQISQLGFADRPYIFLPAGSSSQERVNLLVAGVAAAPPARELREVIASIDPHLAVEVAQLSDNLEQWRAPSRIVAALSSTLALLALVLACTGVFGTVAYAVSRRVREIGIRVALGAAHGDVLGLIVRQGLRPVLIGLAIGLVLAAVASQVLASMLYGLSPHDPLSFVGVTALLFAVALLACYVPARRALRVEPTIALRTD